MTQPSNARQVVLALRDQGLTIATAESLTGGLVCAALVDVPGASLVVRGGIVAYATDLKAALLEVPVDLLAARGAVDPDVASAMADGVRARCGADIGVATTGVAGPDPQDGMPVGTVHLAVAGPGAGRVQVESVLFTGDRNSIRRQSVDSALLLVSRVLDVGAGR